MTKIRDGHPKQNGKPPGQCKQDNKYKIIIIIKRCGRGLQVQWKETIIKGEAIVIGKASGFS